MDINLPGGEFSPIFYNSPAPMLITGADVPAYTMLDVNNAYLTSTNTTREFPIIFYGIIGACIDITDQKLLQKQKDDFIGIATHELKTPVTSIKGYAQVLEKILLKKGDIKEAAMMGKMDTKSTGLPALSVIYWMLQKLMPASCSLMMLTLITSFCWMNW